MNKPATQLDIMFWSSIILENVSNNIISKVLFFTAALIALILKNK